MKNYEEFYDFMDRYTEFYDEVLEKEKEKLEALSSDDLAQINRILSEYQVLVKKTEQYEKKRMELFKELGLENMTFRAIVESESGDCREELEDLFYRFREAVVKTKEYNNKSLEIVRENVKTLGNINYDEGDPACYNKHGTVPEKRFSSMNLLDKKA
ncbi:MAG: flagellar protein FlgN [Ruminococcus sp.]|nr:flagellar protein FlgN [Ruminococcus sp.]